MELFVDGFLLGFFAGAIFASAIWIFAEAKNTQDMTDYRGIPSKDLNKPIRFEPESPDLKSALILVEPKICRDEMIFLEQSIAKECLGFYSTGLKNGHADQKQIQSMKDGCAPVMTGDRERDIVFRSRVHGSEK